MSELKSGIGYEALPAVPRRFVDYVNDHARQGEYGNKEFGPSTASHLYDVPDGWRIVPFTQVLFEDSRIGGIFFDDTKQKDQITFYLGRIRVVSVYHELGYGSSDGFDIFTGDKGILRNPEPTIISTILDGLVELEQAGKMISSAEQILPEQNPR